MSSAPSRRNHQLDFLRGVAILLVLGRHQPLASDKSVHLESIAWYWYNCGWMGVDLFFVLSGFLIGNGLFAEIKAEDKLNARRFLIKRIFKIWPGYFVLMLLLSTGLTISAEEKKHVIWNWFHLQNYFGSCRVQTWSLAVEEHFYLFLPFVLYLLCKYKKINAMPFIALAIAIYCPLGRFLDLKGAYDYSHLRMDALFFGVLLAYLKQLRAPLFANILRTAYFSHRLSSHFRQNAGAELALSGFWRHSSGIAGHRRN
jgi:peptidoglycan/LPS O-acetylase OafA/YrhL